MRLSVEYLPGRCKTLSPISSTTHKSTPPKGRSPTLRIEEAGFSVPVFQVRKEPKGKLCKSTPNWSGVGGTDTLLMEKTKVNEETWTDQTSNPQTKTKEPKTEGTIPRINITQLHNPEMTLTPIKSF